MLKIIKSLVVIVGVVALAATATGALYSDSEVIASSTFSTGSLDLKVNGEDEPNITPFSVSGMVPSQTYATGCRRLKNVGTIDGTLTVKVSNPVSHENGLLEPEKTDGDLPGQEIDPSGYNANTGNGELWDQSCLRIFIDDGAGSHTGNKVWDWDDTTIYSDFGEPGLDYSSYYSIPLNTDLAAGKNITLSPNEAKKVCIEAHFVDDQSSWWWGGMSGVTNNMAMSDDMQFDIEFGLVQ